MLVCRQFCSPELLVVPWIEVSVKAGWLCRMHTSNQAMWTHIKIHTKTHIKTRHTSLHCGHSKPPKKCDILRHAHVLHALHIVMHADDLSAV